MNDKIEEMMNGIGAVAEMSFAFYNDLLKTGFNSVQALQLTQTFLNSVMRSSLNQGNNNAE